MVSDGSDGLYDGAEQVTNGRAEKQEDGYDDNSYQNNDHRILDQSLPFLTWQEDHFFTSFQDRSNCEDARSPPLMYHTMCERAIALFSYHGAIARVVLVSFDKLSRLVYTNIALPSGRTCSAFNRARISHKAARGEGVMQTVRGALEWWKQRTGQVKRETYALFVAYRDPRVPWYAKAFAIVLAGVCVIAGEVSLFRGGC